MKRIYSNKLGEFINIRPDTFLQVYGKGESYSTREIEILKNAGLDEGFLKFVHKVKKMFNGEAIE